MQTQNYFKVGSEFVFIRNVEEDWHKAAALADKTGGRIWVYRSIQADGPWSNLPIIGHRPLEEIIADMELEQNEEELLRLEDELQAYLAA